MGKLNKTRYPLNHLHVTGIYRSLTYVSTINSKNNAPFVLNAGRLVHFWIFPMNRVAVMTFGRFFVLTIWYLAHILPTFNAELIKDLANL